MKTKIALILIFALSHTKASSAQTIDKTMETPSVYNIKINSLSGEAIKLSEFKGKKILFVNVASQCGFTPQYADLQKLHETYKDKLVVIGLPCNQFGNQEPGDAEQIQNFCKVNYGVTFLITEKIEVKGDGQHPLYAWLTTKDLNGKENSSVQWNFQKYLIDEQGNFLDFFYSTTSPLSDKITKYLE